MAINIVQVAGTTSFSTTLYTVPAGRTAKVLVTYFRSGGPGNFIRSNGNNILGGADDITFGASTQLNTTVNAGAGGNQSIGSGTSSGTLWVGPTCWYMGPGQTITTGVVAGLMVYDLQVIEQF